MSSTDQVTAHDLATRLIRWYAGSERAAAWLTRSMTWQLAPAVSRFDLYSSKLPSAWRHRHHWHFDSEPGQTSPPAGPCVFAARTPTGERAPTYRSTSLFIREGASTVGALCEEDGTEAVWLLGRTAGCAHHQLIAAHRGPVVMERATGSSLPGGQVGGAGLADPLELYFDEAASLCVDEGFQRIQRALNS